MGRIVFISIFTICKNESCLFDSRRILFLAVFSRVEDPVPRTYVLVAVVFVDHYNLFFPNQGVVVDAIMNFLSPGYKSSIDYIMAKYLLYRLAINHIYIQDSSCCVCAIMMVFPCYDL